MLGVRALYVCRDIEAGLSEEWAARGRMGSADRPHFGFWRGSHVQTGGQGELASGQHDPVIPLAPVSENAPVSVNGNPGNSAANTAPPTGWV